MILSQILLLGELISPLFLSKLGTGDGPGFPNTYEFPGSILRTALKERKTKMKKRSFFFLFSPQKLLGGWRDSSAGYKPLVSILILREKFQGLIFENINSKFFINAILVFFFAFMTFLHLYIVYLAHLPLYPSPVILLLFTNSLSFFMSLFCSVLVYSRCICVCMHVCVLCVCSHTWCAHGVMVGSWSNLKNFFHHCRFQGSNSSCWTC